VTGLCVCIISQRTTTERERERERERAVKDKSSRQVSDHALPLIAKPGASPQVTPTTAVQYDCATLQLLQCLTRRDSWLLWRHLAMMSATTGVSTHVTRRDAALYTRAISTCIRVYRDNCATRCDRKNDPQIVLLIFLHSATVGDLKVTFCPVILTTQYTKFNSNRLLIQLLLLAFCSLVSPKFIGINSYIKLH